MDAIRFPSARRSGRPLLLRVAAALTAPVGSWASPRLTDEPIVWYAADDRNVPGKITEREPSIVLDAYTDTGPRPIGRAKHFGRNSRRLGVLFGGDHGRAASDVNRLDAVVTSPGGGFVNKNASANRRLAATTRTGDRVAGRQRRGGFRRHQEPMSGAEPIVPAVGADSFNLHH